MRMTYDSKNQMQGCQFGPIRSRPTSKSFLDHPPPPQCGEHHTPPCAPSAPPPLARVSCMLVWPVGVPVVQQVVIVKVHYINSVVGDEINKMKQQ